MFQQANLSENRSDPFPVLDPFPVPATCVTTVAPAGRLAVLRFSTVWKVQLAAFSDRRKGAAHQSYAIYHNQ